MFDKLCVCYKILIMIHEFTVLLSGNNVRLKSSEKKNNNANGQYETNVSSVCVSENVIAVRAFSQSFKI